MLDKGGMGRTSAYQRFRLFNFKKWEIEGLENKITGADKTLLASKTAEQLHLKEERDNKDYDETYGKIAGWDNYVARYVKEAQAAVEEPFDDKRIGEIAHTS